ncbi:MAG: outer membrane protein assembly factor [Prevotellaceae bacterium]|jgi:hypothetical protein|nr:outer membrane protein assembly factor [Prevotellaceae bacterium]
MKKRLCYSGILLLLHAVGACAAHAAAYRDSVKTGWNFGVLPAVSFDSNLGFQYGGLINLFYFGDGSSYPSYLHSIYAEVSQYTKGTTVFRTYYDSKYLLPGLRTTVDVAYLTDKMMKLHGFNGYQASYNAGYLEKESFGEGFYSYDRRLFRIVSGLQGRIGGRLSWAAGVDLYSYKTGAVDRDKLKLGSDSTAYEYYVRYGGIRAEEADGGTHLYLKGGLIYDTRDFEPNPSRGLCTELLLLASPDFAGRGNAHAKLTLVHRQYFTFIPQRLSLAYRVGYQGTLFGSTPWYLQQNFHVLMLRKTLSEGLGSSSTMRGVVRNRIVGDGIAFANVELRLRLAHFRLFNQNWYIATNPFADAGVSVQPYRKAELEQMQENINRYAVARPKLVAGDRETPHVCAGIGLQVVMNQNFIVSADFGKALDDRDGDTGMYVGLNYLF